MLFTMGYKALWLCGSCPMSLPTALGEVPPGVLLCSYLRVDPRWIKDSSLWYSYFAPRLVTAGLESFACACLSASQIYLTGQFL